MIFVFDLDDTLYDESTFILSAFQHTASFLARVTGLNEGVIVSELLEEVKKGRSGVFDRFLNKHGIATKGLVKKCVSLYRGHNPKISLLPEAAKCLTICGKERTYVVTDGNKIVQKNKFLALGLEGKVKKIICTNAYGLDKCKPSPYCFLKICEWEGVSPDKVVYIADDPNKDFVGIKPLGFQTIRVMKGRFRDLKLDQAHEAHKSVLSLADIVDFEQL